MDAVHRAWSLFFLAFATGSVTTPGWIMAGAPLALVLVFGAVSGTLIGFAVSNLMEQLRVKARVDARAALGAA